MGRPLYEIFGGILIFLSSFVPYISERIPRKWKIPLWIGLGVTAIGYASYGIYLYNVAQREQTRKDADNEQALLELKTQIRTLMQTGPEDTLNIRQDLLTLEAELRHLITGNPEQQQAVPYLRPGMMVDLHTPIAAPPRTMFMLQVGKPMTLAAPYVLRLNLLSISDVATPTSFSVTCNTEIYDASFFVAGEPHLGNRKSGFSGDRKTYSFSYDGPPFSNGTSPIVVTISATSPLKIERVEQEGSVSRLPPTVPQGSTPFP
jgi:hypothetical protein